MRATCPHGTLTSAMPTCGSRGLTAAAPTPRASIPAPPPRASRRLAWSARAETMLALTAPSVTRSLAVLARPGPARWPGCCSGRRAASELAARPGHPARRNSARARAAGCSGPPCDRDRRDRPARCCGRRRPRGDRRARRGRTGGETDSRADEDAGEGGDSVGDAEASEASRLVGVRRMSTAVVAWSREKTLESVATILLGVGGVIFPPIWLLGAVVALASKVWDYRDKWVGLAGPDPADRSRHSRRGDPGGQPDRRWVTTSTLAGCQLTSPAGSQPRLAPRTWPGVLCTAGDWLPCRRGTNRIGWAEVRTISPTSDIATERTRYPHSDESGTRTARETVR